MENNNEICDTRLTLGLATNDHLVPKENDEEHKKIICLDLSIIPLHSSDHGTNKIDESNSKTCKNYNKFNNESTNNGMRKKLRLTKEQFTLLEESFKQHSTLAMAKNDSIDTPLSKITMCREGQKQELATKLKLKPRQVEVWFQNKRARTKLKQTEVDSEFLKKWCQSLNDENNRLKKELQELRSSLNDTISSSTFQDKDTDSMFIMPENIKR